VLGLVAYVKSWEHLPKKGIGEVCRFVSDLYGLERVSRDQLDRDRENSRRRADEIQKKAGEEQARNEGRAMELWLKAEPIRSTRRTKPICATRAALTCGRCRRPARRRARAGRSALPAGTRTGKRQGSALHDRRAASTIRSSRRNPRGASHLVEAGRIRQGRRQAATQGVAGLCRPGHSDLEGRRQSVDRRGDQATASARRWC
jgi:hypothetical protein